MARTQAELNSLLVQGGASIVPNADLKKMKRELTGMYLTLGEAVRGNGQRERELLDNSLASIAYLIRTCNEMLDAGLAEAIHHEDSDLPY